MSSTNGEKAAVSGPGVGGPVVSGPGRRGSGSNGQAMLASAKHAMALREAFWHDMCREILTTLSVEGLRRREQAAAIELPGGQIVTSVSPETSAETSTEDDGEVPSEGELFDGRMAILTHGGERIPIGEVYPMLACGISGDGADKAVSQAVECSIFQVLTPAGELYTIPVHEIRAFHALTPQLMRQIEQAGRDNRSRRRGSEDREMPFGFEAYTSLARAERDQQSADPYYPAP
ncbi:MAG: hypothetical protein ACIAQU_10405 [Phycisphaerales bacterium JB064]